MTNGTDAAFSGSIPEIYDRLLVPLIFEDYAADLARRVGELKPQTVLEIAAGTGVATRAMASRLPWASTKLIATDLNQPMLDYAKAKHPEGGQVEWRQADALNLPFAGNTFDVVICQFGAMFFPDKARAFAEARRVLRPGGTFAFSVWDRIEENEFAEVVTSSLESIFPDDPPRFLARTPYGHHDRASIERDLLAGGFGEPANIETVAARSRAESPSVPAIAFCQGTPLRNEIEARAPMPLAEATEVATAAIAKRFGGGSVDGKIQAHVVTVRRPGKVPAP
jgi:SAM-dependent methyltransferase